MEGAFCLIALILFCLNRDLLLLGRIFIHIYVIFMHFEIASSLLDRGKTKARAFSVIGGLKTHACRGQSF
jgi:hypothetical protein